MNTKITSTNGTLSDDSNKTLVFSNDNKLFISNEIDPKFIPFFKDIMSRYETIVYFEHDRPVCPVCDIVMNENGSRKSKPNMHDGIRKEQYVCPECGKTKVTSVEDYIPRHSNYSRDIAEKGLNYDTIAYMSYEAKSELINLENDVEISRKTVYYHETLYSDEFLKREEEINLKLLEEHEIVPSGYYHYDEVRQDGAFSPITSVKFFNLKNFNPCCLGFPPSKFLSW